MNLLPKRDPSVKDGHKLVFVGGTFPALQKSPWCEHSLDPKRLPKTNCNQCWSFYFMNNAEFAKAAMGALPDNEARVTNDLGAKFVKKLKWFAAAIAKAQEVAYILKDRQESEVLAAEVDATVDVDGVHRAIVEVVD